MTRLVTFHSSRFIVYLIMFYAVPRRAFQDTHG